MQETETQLGLCSNRAYTGSDEQQLGMAAWSSWALLITTLVHPCRSLHMVALAATGVSLPIGPGKFPEWSLMKWAGSDGCFKPVMVARGYNLTLGGQGSGSSPEPGGGMGEWFPQTKSRCNYQN